MSSFVPTNYFMAQRWAKEQLQGTDIDPSAPSFYFSNHMVGMRLTYFYTIVMRCRLAK